MKPQDDVKPDEGQSASTVGLEQAKAWCSQCAKDEKNGPVWTLQDGIDAYLAGAKEEREAFARWLDDEADRQEAAWNAHLASGNGGPATSYHAIPRAYAERLRKRSNMQGKGLATTDKGDSNA